MTNLAWDEGLANKSSPMFQELASKMKVEMERIVNDDPDMDALTVDVIEFAPGSVVVRFRISSAKDSDRMLTKEEFGEKLDKAILNEDQALTTLYKIDPRSVEVDCKHRHSCHSSFIF